MRSENATHRRATGIATLTLALITTLSACATAPTGPGFLRVSDPAPPRGRIYLYREDARSSPSTLKVSIGGREIGTLRDGEYETLELPAGVHELRVGLRSLAFVAWGWNEQRVLVERAYFEEMSHNEIAEATGLPLGTIKSRIRLALERLRHAMN